MFRPSENFLSTACIACSLVVPLVTTTVLPFRSVGAEMVEAFGTISLVPATNISGENATCLLALRIGRGRSAFEVDLVLHHRRNAVVRCDLDVFDPEIGVVDLDADLLDDGLAEFEAVADRPVGLIEKRERRRTLAIAKTHDMCVLDIGKRRAKPFAAAALGASRRRQQNTAASQLAASTHRVRG